MLAEGLAGFARAEAALEKRVAEQLEGARAETARLAQASASRLLEEASRAAAEEPVVAAARDAEEQVALAVEQGARARVRGLGAEGVVVAFDGDWAQLDVEGKRLRVRRGELEPARGRSGKNPAGEKRRRAEPREQVSPASESPSSGPTVEINVIGQRVEEALRRPTP